MQKVRHILSHMGAATFYAVNSHAKRRKVGAILTQNGTPIACGWNGTAPGEPNRCETEDGSETLPSVIHAEPNAYKQLELRGESPKETELFVTCLPCPDCARLIVEKGHTVRVHFSEVYRSLEGAKILLDNKIELVYVENDVSTHLLLDGAPAKIFSVYDVNLDYDFLTCKRFNILNVSTFSDRRFHLHLSGDLEDVGHF